MKAAAAGEVLALLVDGAPTSLARTSSFARSSMIRRPAPALHPLRVLLVIATGDVEAFAFGRYGLAGVLEERALPELDLRLQRLAAEPSPDPRRRPTPLSAPPRAARLTFREEHDPPTVMIGYRHAPETLAGLARYVRVLREHAHESTVFSDVATLIDVMVREDLTCQTSLASKAGATHDGQFIGSFEFYRELRRTRYGLVPDPPGGEIAMDVFISIDEVLHEVLHLLFLANAERAGLAARHHRLAEEFGVTWWQAVVHNRVFPEWLTDRRILEINDDFMLYESNRSPANSGGSATSSSHTQGIHGSRRSQSSRCARATWGSAPISRRLITSFASRPEAAFLVPGAAERLAVPVDFDAYPPIPATLQVR